MRTALLLACASAVFAQQPFSGAAALDAEINGAIERQLIPGAVVVIGHQGAIVYRNAYGSRALVPKREPMSVDTIFDAASLTKVVATTIRNLLTHFSGIRPELDLEPAWSGYETGINKALIEKPRNPPGVRFVYSDINFILLGEIVHRVSRKSLDRYARETIFDPLEMKHTRFLPLAEWVSRIAPTG